jgi:amino acid adenylation domain-containing protein
MRVFTKPAALASALETFANVETNRPRHALGLGIARRNPLRHQMNFEPAQCVCNTPRFHSIAEQISEIRDICPHAVALSDGDRKLSYSELDRRATQFAVYLSQLGVVPGGTVAICAGRSFDWITAALGIMRAGASYVPLDPAWPDSRLLFALEDSGATVLVAQETLLNRLNAKVQGLDPARDAAAIAAIREVACIPVDPDSLAYVIYTSGSTGVPKGVEITHANLANLAEWHRKAFSVTRHDRASHLAGLGFDAAVWEIWPNLAAGARICLADDAIRSSADLMQQWILRERVTVAFVPTVHAEAMIAMDWPATTALRLLLTGGDILHHGPTAKLPFEVVNNYGPTECTVVATSGVLSPGLRGIPPIGRAIDGARLYLLNDRGDPVPNGTIGEICIGGRGVGRGYRNLPELTERCFLPDLFEGTAGARMYRTGDRGIQYPNGKIEFRGRLDRQTKIRGQRVELDEIASILCNHPSIDFATATTIALEKRECQLVAYVLPKSTAMVPTVQELQSYLLCSLPDYMVPSIFVRLSALPLSPNGKLDLTNLARPTDANLLEKPAAKVPTTPIEKELLAIVQKLLEDDAVIIEDNFFLAGGHSLLGMQLVLQIREAFGVDLSLEQLFKSPTVERLAVMIETSLKERSLGEIWTDLLGRPDVKPDDNFLDLGGRPELVDALQQRIATNFGTKIPIGELYLSPTLRQQVRLAQGVPKSEGILPPGVLALHPGGALKPIFWMHYVNGNLAKQLGPDQPFIVITLTPEDVASLGETPTLQSIAAIHVQKIVATQNDGPYIIGGQCLGGILAYEVASQLHALHQVSRLVLLDPPNLAYKSIARSLSYMLYLSRNALRQGVRISLGKLRVRLQSAFGHATRTELGKTEMQVTQLKIVAAARDYRPKKYKGNVLLLLASDRPRHMNFLPGWRPLLANLALQYVGGQHGELLNEKNVRSVADAIASHLKSPDAVHSDMGATSDGFKVERSVS